MSRSRSGRQPRGRSAMRRWARADLVAHKRTASVALLPTDPTAWDHSDEEAKEIAADLAAMDAEIWFDFPPLTDEEEDEMIWGAA